MRRQFKKPRVKRVLPPKPIEATKPERPRRSNLKSIYKDFISSDIEQRVETLRRVVAWYDKCLLYVGYSVQYKWTKPQLREKNAAELARTSAINTVHNNFKEEKLMEAIKHYEKMVASFKPPLLSTYLKRWHHERNKLETRRKKLNKRYGAFLKLLQTILRPKNIEGKDISIRIDRLSVDYRIDTEGNITLNNKMVAYLSKLSRKQGMLSVVVDIFPMLMEAAGRLEEKDERGRKTGRVLISNAKCKSAVVPMLSSLNKYYLSVDAPRKLVRRPRKGEKKERSL